MLKFLLAFVLSITSTIFSGAALHAADLSGLLYRVTGAVEISADGGKAWKPARVGAGLAKNDRIRTGAGASALLLMDDGSYYNVKEKCDLEILELTYDRKTKVMESSFKINKGRFLGRVTKLISNANATFRTPTALVAVRGTELAIDVADSGETAVYLNEGRIVVTDFVTERGLPGDQRELLLDLIHEVALKNREAVKVSSTGIRRDKRSKAQLDASGAEFAELAKEGDAAARQGSAVSFEESQSRRKKSREEVLK